MVRLEGWRRARSDHALDYPAASGIGSAKARAMTITERHRIAGIAPQRLGLGGRAIRGAGPVRETRDALRACSNRREAIAVLPLAPAFQRR